MDTKLYKVTDWNREKTNQKKYTLVYTLGNGSMLDEPRKRGYVVEKRLENGAERSKYHSNIEKAKADLYSDKF